MDALERKFYYQKTVLFQILEVYGYDSLANRVKKTENIETLKDYANVAKSHALKLNEINIICLLEFVSLIDTNKNRILQ